MVVSLVALTRLKKTCQKKNVIPMNRIAIQYITMHVINKTAPKVNRFAGFCHHCLVTMSAHTHVYHYPLFKSGMKTGL